MSSESSARSASPASWSDRGASAHRRRPAESSSSTHEGPPSRLALIAAFAAVYLIWGSTYLAIRFAIETIPPLLMAGVRFLVAGGLLYGWLRIRGAPRPRKEHWRSAVVIGALLLLGGNGALVWAEQWVPSGLAALLVATVPLWMVLVEWLSGRGPRPGLPLLAGIGWGLLGVGLLVGTDPVVATSREAVTGGIVVLLGAVAWAVGSIAARHAPRPPVPRLGSALQMLAGGALLLAAGLVGGEGERLALDALSGRSLLALAYLIVFGSLVALTAYLWLLRVSTPARVSTYAYVNPVVALFLGWALADEPLTSRTLLAAAVILSAVVLITVRKGRRRRKPPGGEAPHGD